MSEEKCKFYKKQFLSKYCELFKQPCYGKHCNFIKEFTRLNDLEQQLKLKDKMIELIMEEYYFEEDKPHYLQHWESKALAELRGE